MLLCLQMQLIIGLSTLSCEVGVKESSHSILVCKLPTDMYTCVDSRHNIATILQNSLEEKGS